MNTATQERRSSRVDAWIGAAFAVGSIVFVVLMAAHSEFFDWAFTRHQNVLSWYIRPILLIPFIAFAWRRSHAGVWGSVFAMLTSMAWFPTPANPDSSVAEFLEIEREYLTQDWGASKVLGWVLVMTLMAMLALAFWRRSLVLGGGVLVLIAAAKVTWSVLAAGDAGLSVVIPASVGLVICIAAVLYADRRLRARRSAAGGRE